MSEVVSEGGAGGGRLALETLGRLVGSSSSRGLSLEGEQEMGIILMPQLDQRQNSRHSSPSSQSLREMVVVM